MAGESAVQNMDDGRKTVVPDFLQANDWRFDRFAALALTLQAIVLLLTFLDDHGLVPLHVRGLFAFLFYTYVPGLVLLRALRMHRLGGVMTTLLSVAASVIILMLSGFILNLIHTEFGGPMPFTTATMLAGQTVVFLLLLALAFVTDRRYGDDPTLDISPFLTAPAFALYSLPLVAVLATYLLNGWNFAWLQVILLLAVAAAMLAIVVTRLPSQLYPLAVACIALAVLLHTSLVSRFVVEWADVSFEYWSANKTLINGYWDMVEIGSTDSVLSISVLAPTYALLTGFDLNTIFKVCYPTLFVFVPLGIFCIARPKLGLTGALLAAFLIISGRMFFTEFLGLGRQMVAELLLISIAAILLHRSDIKTHRTVMVWLLVLGIAVSHYAIVAIAFPALVASAILFILIDRKSITRSILAKVASYIAIVVIPPALWYGNVSGSKVLDRILSNYQMILDGGGSLKIKDDFIPTLLFQGDVSLHSWSIAVTFLLSFILLIYGLLHFILSRRPLTSHDRAYLALVAPFIAYTPALFFFMEDHLFISWTRFYHICLLFTAPLIIYGGVQAFNAMGKTRSSGKINKASLPTMGAILVAFFLSSSGIINIAVGGPQYIEFDMNILDVPRHSDGAFLAANFTIDKGADAPSIYADANRAYLIDMLGGKFHPLKGAESPPINRKVNTLHFLASENLKGMIWLENPKNGRINKTYVPMGDAFSNELLIMDKVYCSQESELYYRKY